MLQIAPNACPLVSTGSNRHNSHIEDCALKSDTEGNSGQRQPYKLQFAAPKQLQISSGTTDGPFTEVTAFLELRTLKGAGLYVLDCEAVSSHRGAEGHLPRPGRDEGDVPPDQGALKEENGQTSILGGSDWKPEGHEEKGGEGRGS